MLSSYKYLTLREMTDPMRGSLDPAKQPVYDVLKLAFPGKLTEKESTLLVAVLDEDGYGFRSIAALLSAMRDQLSYTDSYNDVLTILSRRIWKQDDIKRMRLHLCNFGYGDLPDE
ncbi:hypothetical protein GCM10008938_52770 [Deinococcus roseus]|uniref:Uncharacterized protein n=2 Tax=Deinococcus roseus TaxID=392414 RepID=A0ABQ2DJY2_9DEIO|nr:hypothetical protein GCM10008938_52770 [Deinococcus roseus]